jgi:hypothetical protein
MQREGACRAAAEAASAIGTGKSRLGMIPVAHRVRAVDLNRMHVASKSSNPARAIRMSEQKNR